MKMKKLLIGIIAVIALFAISACAENTPTADSTVAPTEDVAEPTATPDSREEKYNEAMALYNGGEYSEALKIFKTINGYKDVADKINECQTKVKEAKYNEAMKLKEQGDYEEAMKLFLDAYGYKDAADQVPICRDAAKKKRFDAAAALLAEGKYAEALEGFKHENLADYEGVNEKIAECETALYGAVYAGVQVGGIMTFGSYEQDNDLENGAEAIEWVVLAKEDGKIQLMSKYVLEAMAYDTTGNDVNWETCTLRNWLNSDFYNSAFNNAEKAQILTTTVTSDDKKKEHQYEVQDKVYCLGAIEADLLLATDEDRAAYPTQWALANGARINATNKHSWWWCRTHGDNNLTAVIVYTIGQVEWSGHAFSTAENTVRPVMWIQPQ